MQTILNLENKDMKTITEKLKLTNQSKLQQIQTIDAETIIDHLLIIVNIDSHKTIKRNTIIKVIKSSIEEWINKNNVETVEYICHSYDERIIVDHIINYNVYGKKFNLTTKIKDSDYCFDNKKYNCINKFKDPDEKNISITPYIDLYIRDEYICISGSTAIYCVKK